MKINTENITFTTNNKFIKDGAEYDLLDFPCEENFIQPVFDYKGLKWVEGANENDRLQSLIIFYNNELQFASKANAEFACGIITEESFEEVKIYMKAIDPYKDFQTILEIKRPEIFKKYL